MTRLPRSRLSKRNWMNKNRYKNFSQPAETKNYANAYVPIKINEELNLFLSRGYEHVSMTLYKHKNILFRLLSQPAYFFHINNQLESNTSP